MEECSTFGLQAQLGVELDHSMIKEDQATIEALLAKKALSLGRVGALIESSMGKANTGLSNLSPILPTQRKGFVDVSETQYMNPLLDDPTNITGVT